MANVGTEFVASGQFTYGPEEENEVVTAGVAVDHSGRPDALYLFWYLAAIVDATATPWNDADYGPEQTGKVKILEGAGLAWDFLPPADVGATTYDSKRSFGGVLGISGFLRGVRVAVGKIEPGSIVVDATHSTTSGFDLDIYDGWWVVTRHRNTVQTDSGRDAFVQGQRGGNAGGAAPWTMSLAQPVSDARNAVIGTTQFWETDVVDPYDAINSTPRSDSITFVNESFPAPQTIEFTAGAPNSYSSADLIELGFGGEAPWLRQKQRDDVVRAAGRGANAPSSSQRGIRARHTGRNVYH